MVKQRIGGPMPIRADGRKLPQRRDSQKLAMQRFNRETTH